MFGRRNTQEAAPTPSVPPTDAVANNADVGQELESLWQPSQARQRKSIDQLLLERGQITEEQLDQAKKVHSQTPGKTLVQILQTMNAATEAQILSAQAEILDIPFEMPHKAEVDPEAYALLTTDYIKKNFCLPIRFAQKTLVGGMADPSNVFFHDEVR